MLANFHFISGLPRSGSTLLSAILKQNPRFHADMSSPVASLIQGALEQIGAEGEFYSFFNNAKRKTLTKAIVTAYYEDVTKEVIFDTNRIWTARMHQLVEMYEDFKIICLVRDPAWVMDSFEKIYRKNPFDYSKMFSPQNRVTVYSRCESLLNGVVGSALTAMKEAFYGPYSDRLLLIDYDLLTRFPEKTLTLLYKFLGEEYFQHEFENVDYSSDEFDYNLGVHGLHTVSSKVEFKSRKTILPPDLFKKYNELAFWKDSSGSSANIIGSKKIV
jgi:sulfotransferase